MGFVTNKEGITTTSTTYAKERKLLFDLWTILKGDEFVGILKYNLCLFLLAVIGIHWRMPKI